MQEDKRLLEDHKDSLIVFQSHNTEDGKKKDIKTSSAMGNQLKKNA